MTATVNLPAIKMQQNPIPVRCVLAQLESKTINEFPEYMVFHRMHMESNILAYCKGYYE